MREEQPSTSISEPATTHHRVTSWDTRPRSLSFPTKITPDGSPSRADQTLFPRRGYGPENFFSGPYGPRKPKGRPDSLDGHPNEGQAHERLRRRYASIDRASIHGRAPARLTLDEIPVNGYQGFLKTIQFTKTKSHSLTREGSKTPLGRLCPNHPDCRGPNTGVPNEVELITIER